MVGASTTCYAKLFLVVDEQLVIQFAKPYLLLSPDTCSCTVALDTLFVHVVCHIQAYKTVLKFLTRVYSLVHVHMRHIA